MTTEEEFIHLREENRVLREVLTQRDEQVKQMQEQITGLSEQVKSLQDRLAKDSAVLRPLCATAQEPAQEEREESRWTTWTSWFDLAVVVYSR